MAQTLSHLTAYVGEGGREDGSNSVSSDCHVGEGGRMAQTLSHLTAYVGEGGREDGSNSVSSDCLCGRGREGGWLKLCLNCQHYS